MTDIDHDLLIRIDSKISFIESKIADLPTLKDIESKIAEHIISCQQKNFDWRKLFLLLLLALGVGGASGVSITEIFKNLF